MTFVEAAIEILKREGKPLPTRRLAEMAVKLNLLSVVGRDPAATMQERLDDALEHGGRHPDLVRLKPDTFGLHDYPPQPYPANGTQAHATPAAGAGDEKKPRRRRGRRGDDVAGVDETAATAAADAGGDEDVADDGDGDDLMDDVDEIDEHTGPLLAPALGAEDVTRTEDDRTIRPEIRGSRDDRRHHRGDRQRRDRHKDRKGHEGKQHEARGHE